MVAYLLLLLYAHTADCNCTVGFEEVIDVLDFVQPNMISEIL